MGQTQETEATDANAGEDSIQALVYGLSHDMGAPLRAVVQFSQLLGRRLEGQLDEKERYWLELIQDNGEQAQQMLEALLLYSRLQTRRSPDRAISLSQLLDKQLKALAGLVDGRKVEIERPASLPDVSGCYEHWELLLHSLLDNALRYQSKDMDHLILLRISAKQTDKQITICVEDNGVGVHEAALPLLVNPFKRMQSPQDYKGIGMGLSYCERIAQLNGGRLECSHSLLGGLAVSYTVPADRGA